MTEQSTDAQPASNTSTPNRNEYQRQYAQANKEKLLARRRQLYAESDSRRVKDKEYYLKIKDTPEYKQRTREAARRWCQKNRKPETEEEKRTRYRNVGKLLADRQKAKGTTVINKKDKSWMDSIPDLSQSYGDLVEKQTMPRFLFFAL